jgi:hypothetical protein
LTNATEPDWPAPVRLPPTMNQTLLPFEQDRVEAELAAKAADAKAKADAKEKEASEKLSRRLAREAAYRKKHPPGHAQCGINWYPAGSGWTHCHRCGQALIFTTDPNAKPQVCAGRKR